MASLTVCESVYERSIRSGPTMEKLVKRLKLLHAVNKSRGVRVDIADWGFSLTPSSKRHEALKHGLPLVSYGTRTGKWYVDLGDNGDLSATPKEALDKIKQLKLLVKKLNTSGSSGATVRATEAALLDLANWYVKHGS